MRTTAIIFAIGISAIIPSLAIAADDDLAAPQGEAVTPKRLPPRPEEPAIERAARIKQAREIYEQPPGKWTRPKVDPTVTWVELGLLPPVEHPRDNPTSKQKVELGKRLFFDPRLSGSGQIACASCHDPDLGWADGRTTSFGESRKALRRNAPGLLNVAFGTSFFWDGRAGSLEEQAEAVLLNPQEMHAEPDAVVAKVGAVPAYRAEFAAAFDGASVSLQTITRALATFERTLVGGRSKFDAFLRGDHKALSDEAVLGLDLFRGRAQCMNCHNGPTFSDGQFHDLGLSYYGRELEDLGRYRVSGLPKDVGKFRTPSLRNLRATAPYMHNGLFELDGVLNMYNAGMSTLRRKPAQADDPLFPTKDPLLRPLGLNKRDLADLKAFLEALNEPKLRVRPPEIPAVAADAARPGP